MSKKNPPWNRDELILSLDLYFRHNPLHINKTHPEVIKLSDTLNKLTSHLDKPDSEKFRNPNGVYMKLCNFLRFDPDYQGVGLQRGGKLEKEIWEEFSGDKEKLRKISQSIVQSLDGKTNKKPLVEDEEDEFPEGKVLYRKHRYYERDRTPVEKIKSKYKKMGKLHCMVCGFDFKLKYGDIGEGYIECHHTIPVSEYQGIKKTKVSDLSLVCSNCHRMLHRKRPWMSIDQLKCLIKGL